MNIRMWQCNNIILFYYVSNLQSIQKENKTMLWQDKKGNEDLCLLIQT